MYTPTRKCLECSADTKRREFCSAKCRSAFHNRRTRRGALVYDVLMVQVASPEAYAKYNMGTRLAVQIAAWRREDAGRRTWSRPMDVVYALPVEGSDGGVKQPPADGVASDGEDSSAS